MKAKESASRHRKRSTELRGQSDKLANSPRNTCSDKGTVEAGCSILLSKRGVDVGSSRSSMTGESKGKVEAGRSILLGKRVVE